MRKPWGPRTFLAGVVTAVLVLATGGAVLADPATPLAAAVEAASGTAAGVTETATEAATSATETVAATAGSVTETVEQTAGSETESLGQTAESVSETVEQTAESVTETVEQTAESVTETVEQTAESVTETVEQTAESVTETGADAVESVVETTSDPGQTVTETASDAGASAEGALDGAGAASVGTAPDSAEPRSASSNHPGGTTTTSPSVAHMAPGPHAGPAVVLGASSSLGAGPVVEDVRGVGSSVSWFGDGGSLDAASRPVLSSADTEATCVLNLHRGVETAVVPCPSGTSVLGVTLGVTGVAILSFLVLALALSAVGTGALALERRLQRG